MLERIFSPRGRILYLASAFVMFGYVFWQLFTNTGIVGWVNEFQAYYIFSGYYYFELTVLIFIFPIFIISFTVGLLHDYLAKQGIFTGHEDSLDFAKPNSNLTVEYQATTRKEVIDQVRSRYQAQIQQLKLLGFDEFGFYREIVPRLGMPMGLSGFFGAFAMLANEVTRMGPDLTVNAFFPLLASRKDSSYVFVSKMGINFYTSFLDGTCLISSTFQGIEIRDESQKLYKIAIPRSIQSAWVDHQQQVKKFCIEGKTIRDYISMADYFSIIDRVGDYMLHHRVKVSKSPRNEPSIIVTITSALVAVIIFFGIFMGFFFAFTFVDDGLSYIYPGCWVVKGLHSDSLLLHFLAIPVCITISWFLARLQHNPFIINGMGTQFYEVEPVNNSQEYISTKWLTCLGVPLMPVRSYLVTREVIQFQDKETYTLQPLKELNWRQVKETFRKAWVRYLIMTLIIALIMGALIAWPIAECG